jgi:hypothetical protein
MQWSELIWHGAHTYNVWSKTFRQIYLEVDENFEAHLLSWLGCYSNM